MHDTVAVVGFFPYQTNTVLIHLKEGSCLPIATERSSDKATLWRREGILEEYFCTLALIKTEAEEVSGRARPLWLCDCRSCFAKIL